jgi:5-methylcytosine-specific restriction endonuclease McrA
MRTGSYEDRPFSRGTRRQDPRGYWQLYLPEHPLADGTGHVWEHRKIVYERYGDALPPCELCGKLVNWKTVHIDHEDENPANNDPKNLRPLCRVCNVGRTAKVHHEAKGRHAITFDGETKTAAEWARDPRVKIAGHTIMVRKRRGMSDYDALFGPKLTHTGFRKPPPPPQPKHHRSNAVALTINGVTKTSAEWAREPGCTVCDSTIRMRFRAGWPHDRAVFDPPKVMNKKARRLERRIEQRKEAA